MLEMASKRRVAFFVLLIILMSEINSVNAVLGMARALRAIGSKAMTMDLGDLNLLQRGPKFAKYDLMSGKIAYRSSVMASLSQLDRGETEAAMKSLRVAMATLTMETTKTFGLPVMSTVIDKIVTKYGSSFPKTISKFVSYNDMLGRAILDQASIASAPGMVDNADEVLDQLGTLKNRIKTDFGNEVTSFLKSRKAHADFVKPLKQLKTWAKVGKWGSFMAGPVFDVANIAFIGWKLNDAIKSGNQLKIATLSLGLTGSIVGVSTFIVGSLAAAGSVLAATAGPVGAIVGCILTLASLIIDVIISYDPSMDITKQLELVNSLTEASKKSLEELHEDLLRNATIHGIDAGFNQLFEVNQGMLVHAYIHDKFDTIKGFKSDNQSRLLFTPEITKKEGDLLVVGETRVFDKSHYSNWLFKPKGTEEIGYNFYGKKLLESDGGISVRVSTDMVTNDNDNMWFWLNGANITTYAAGEENKEVDDNVQIGDFRSLYPLSDRYISIKTGGGNDMVQITGIICSAHQQSIVQGKCLIGDMGDGLDTLSFEGMDTRDEKLQWLMDNEDFSNTQRVVGIKFDMRYASLSYKLKSKQGRVRFVRVGGLVEVDKFIGSPLDDIVYFDDKKDFEIRESAGRNMYTYYIKSNEDGRQHIIEDTSETPGTLVIKRERLSWKSIVFNNVTNVILILLGQKTQEIFLKRCSPGLEHFKVGVNSEQPKKISELAKYGGFRGIVFPFVPYPYGFDKDLLAGVDQPTFIELLLPTDAYPTSPVTYTFTLSYADSSFIISEELLDALSNNNYVLTVQRQGSADSAGSWTMSLKKPDVSGGWKVNVGQTGTFVIGAVGNFQDVCNLERQKRSEVNINNEYRSIMEKREYDFTENFYGTEHPDKLSLQFPKRLTKRDPADNYIIDLKGPEEASVSNRNELVFSDDLAIKFIKYKLRRYVVLSLKRASVHDDWHLLVYSYWEKKLLRVDVTLKGVHAIIFGERHDWTEVVNLVGSKELSYDLNQLLYDKSRPYFTR